VSTPNVQVSAPEDMASHFQLPTNSQQLGLYQFYDQHGILNQNHLNDLWDPSLFLPAAEASSSGSLTGPDSSMDVVNLNFMDEAFYDQMSFIFSKPFGEMPDPYAIINGDMADMSNTPTSPM
jgi:hypothetical protein